MSQVWWSLPGPAGFVDYIVEELRRGRSLQLCLPSIGCEGIKAQVGRLVGDIDGLVWESLDLDGDRGSPVDVLYRLMAPGAPPGTARNAKSLLDESECRGSVVWVDGIAHLAWPAWRAFLADFEAASRGRDLTDRTMLCLALRGWTSADAAASDVCLAVREWRGVVSSVDSWIHAARLNGDRGRSPTQRWLRVATIAQLSMWDPLLAEDLAGLTSAALLSPLERLRDYGRERGWDAQSGASGWRDGSEGTWDGRRCAHTAWLAAAGDEAPVRRRLWKAQAQALMPFLEEQRSELLVSLDAHIRGQLPFTPKGESEPIKEPHDLELGHIQTLIHDRGVHRQTWSKVDLLRRIRNSLTHFDLVPADLLFNRALADEFDRN